MVAKSRPQYSHIEETQTTVDVSSTATEKTNSKIISSTKIQIRNIELYSY